MPEDARTAMSPKGRGGNPKRRGGAAPAPAQDVESRELDGDVVEVRVSAAIEVMLARPAPSDALGAAVAETVRELAERVREAAALREQAADGKREERDGRGHLRRRLREAEDAAGRLEGELEALRAVEAETAASPPGQRVLGACRAVYLMLLARGRGAKVSKIRTRLHKKHLRSDFAPFFRSLQVTRCLLTCFPTVFHVTERGTAWIRSAFEAQDPALRVIDDSSSVECSPQAGPTDAASFTDAQAGEWVLV